MQCIAIPSQRRAERLKSTNEPIFVRAFPPLNSTAAAAAKSSAHCANTSKVSLVQCQACTNPVKHACTHPCACCHTACAAQVPPTHSLPFCWPCLTWRPTHPPIAAAWQPAVHQPVQAARAQQCCVDEVRAAGGCQHHNTPQALHTVQFREQLVDHAVRYAWVGWVGSLVGGYQVRGGAINMGGGHLG
jgi:hypothetical protein